VVDIIAYGKAEMAKTGLKFVSIPVLSIPYLDKTFYSRTIWAESPDELKTKLATCNPIIIFDQTGNYGDNSVRGFREKLPSDWKRPNAIFVRVINDIDINTWSKILSNVLEPENLNFTFKWDFEYYSHPHIESYNKKMENIKMNQSSYDDRERAEYDAAHTAPKFSFRR